MGRKTEGNEDQKRKSDATTGSSKQREHEQDPSHPKQKTTHPVRND